MRPRISIRGSVRLSVRRSIGPSIRLSVRPSVRPSIRRSVHRSVRRFVCALRLMVCHFIISEHLMPCIRPRFPLALSLSPCLIFCYVALPRFLFSFLTFASSSRQASKFLRRAMKDGSTGRKSIGSLILLFLGDSLEAIVQVF